MNRAPRRWPALLVVLAPLLASRIAAEEGREQRWPADSDVRVEIELLSGRIEIAGWERDEVRLRARGEGRDNLDVEASPDRISIRAPHRGANWLAWRGGVEVELRVDVPSRSHVRARIVDGSIRARDVDGTVSFHAANGEIDLRGSPSEAQLETMTSDIRLSGASRRVDARTISGSIELRGVSGEIEASTASGSIRVEGGTLTRADLRTLSGEIGLAAALAPRASAHLKSYSGGIRLALPPDTSARFDVQTFSGQIVNDLGPAPRSPRLRGLGHRLDFEAGDGGGRVRIETFSGEVKIEVDD